MCASGVFGVGQCSQPISQLMTAMLTEVMNQSINQCDCDGEGQELTMQTEAGKQTMEGVYVCRPDAIATSDSQMSTVGGRVYEMNLG
jgi:hypothetical protein